MSAPGAYWLWAAADGHVAGQRLVEIRPGESAEFDLELVASCAVPIELELPVPTETWRAIEYTVRGQGGEVWVNERLRNYQGRTSPYCRELSLPRGSHTLTIARDGREVGRWPLVVDGAPGPPQRFSLRE